MDIKTSTHYDFEMDKQEVQDDKTETKDEESALIVPDQVDSNITKCENCKVFRLLKIITEWFQNKLVLYYK